MTSPRLDETTPAGMARICAASDIAVIPIYGVVSQEGRRICSCRAGRNCKSPGKHPLWPKWQELATTDPGVVGGLWPVDPQPWCRTWNIGIVAGARSRLVVVDIDPDHGGDETLALLEQEHGALPPTPRFLTGGGGQHILFGHPGVPIGNSAGKLGPGIDTRGDGGYIVAPPSEHISGRRYAISVDHHPEEVPFAPLPTWIMAALGAGTMGSRRGDTDAVTRRDWSAFARRKIGEGQRNAELTSLVGMLFGLAYRPDHVEVMAELVLSWNQTHCSPPLDDEEVFAVIDSIAGRQATSIGGPDDA